MTAVELGLTGWVRNRWDSSVEVVAEGSQPALDSLETALRHGPRSAFVTGVSIDHEPANGEFSRFLVRMTE
jgi:acylphosphatase